MKSDSGDLEQVKELVRRADWLIKNFRFGDFYNTPGDKRRFLEEVVDSIVIPSDNSTNKEVQVKLKLPSPELVEAVTSLSMHITT